MTRFSAETFLGERESAPFVVSIAGIGECHCQQIVVGDAGLWLTIVSDQLLDLSSFPMDEPRETQLAQVAAGLDWRQHLVVVRHPSAWLSVGAIDELAGFRFMAIDASADLAIWDAALDRGMPIAAMRDDVVLASVPRSLSSLIMILAFGNFYCISEGYSVDLEEVGRSVLVKGPESMEITPVTAGGFFGAPKKGSEYRYDDIGNETWVRLQGTLGDEGRLLTQVRFVGPG